MDDLKDLPHIGPHLARALADAGIDTPNALREVGSVEAWWRIHPTFDCMNSLLALEAAVQGVPKRELDEATRHRLRAAARGAREECADHDEAEGSVTPHGQPAQSHSS